MKLPDVYAYRRDLPHWRLVGAVYFVTFRLHPLQPDLGFEDRTTVVKTLTARVGQLYELQAHVVMNNHVHVLVKPLGLPLERIVQPWKSIAAARLQRTGRKGAIWQREYFDRIVRDEAERLEKMRYIAQNPFKRWPELEAYRWVDPQLSEAD